jgi:hypothetical protein
VWELSRSIRGEQITPEELRRKTDIALNISDKTQNQTTKCIFNFQCLNEETRDVCKIDRCLVGNSCFLETVKPIACPYKMIFGYSYMCCCPTRAELYKRYRI